MATVSAEALAAMRARRAAQEAWFAEQDRDDTVLSRAGRAKELEAESAAAMRMGKSREPKRNGTHWAMVLKEMTWLQREIAKESRARQSGARRCVQEIERKNLGLGGREARRAAEDEKQRRAVASTIAKGVKAFWKKVEKVVVYRAQHAAANKRKAALDEHLDFLVGQTEKYTSHIKGTLRIKDNAGGVAAEALPSRATTPATSVQLSEHDDDEFKADAENEADDEGTLEEEEKLAAAAGEEDDHEAELDDLQAEADLPIEEILRRHYGGAQGAAAAGGGNGGAANGGGGGQPAAQAAEAAAEAGMGVGEDMDVAEAEQAVLLQEEDAGAVEDVADEYAADGEDEVDDEATLEEEERLAAAAGEEDDHDAELDDLQAEADLPIEEILRRHYGGAGGAGDAADGVATAGPSSGAGPSAPGAAEAEQVVLLQAAGTAPDDAGDEYVASGGEEQDDEATLEEEEQLAAAAGEEDGHEAELDDLQNEADLPIEEVLKRYYGSGAASGQPGDDVMAEAAEEHAVADESGDDSEAEAMEGIDELKLGALYGDEQAGAAASGGAVSGAASGAEQAAAKGTADALNLTKVPFLLRATLRPYQHVGMDWLATVYRKNLNCILADEMGLGKTLMTISLLAWLACERGIWGPHLVVVPTSVMINWETEFRRFCPAFKLLTYFGTVKERREKRRGWSKPNSFHVCITTYRLVIQDAAAFKRKRWRYLILDEAHMIKNWRSQRWQTLLNFNAARRLLLTGTPLQNDLMELWSLMHFLMPHVFRSHAEFRQWFSQPVQSAVEGSADEAAARAAANKKIVGRLHAILRPFLLRRLKKDVEKSLPPKVEHVIMCRMSKRQRLLYEDFISRADVKVAMQGGSFIGVLNVLMQLRKVCNHPDLFEGRAIISAFDMPALQLHLPSLVAEAASKSAALASLGLAPLAGRLDDHPPPSWARIAAVSQAEALQLAATAPLQGEAARAAAAANAAGLRIAPLDEPSASAAAAALRAVQARQAERDRQWRAERAASFAALSERRVWLAGCHPYPGDLLAVCAVQSQMSRAVGAVRDPRRFWEGSAALGGLVMAADPAARAEACGDVIGAFTFAIPKARAPMPQAYCSRVLAHRALSADSVTSAAVAEAAAAPQLLLPYHQAAVRQQLFFPDRRLIQFDCGKLQELAELLRKLKRGGHRAILFTQMSKMLDVMEEFINLHGYTYLRLDGTTSPEQRQILMTRYNTNPKIFLFISSTRSGGVGVNLTGADTVVFYDSDWNPSMDAQAQDRCHRIGQTRTVHIYRLITEKTIEENIKKKSDQKKLLDSLVIQQGEFNTDTLHAADGAGQGHNQPDIVMGSGSGAIDPRDLLEGLPGAATPGARAARASRRDMEAAMADLDDDADVAARAAAAKEARAEEAEFADVDKIPDGDEGGEGGSDREAGGHSTPTPTAGGEAGGSGAEEFKSDDAMMAEIQRRAGGGDGDSKTGKDLLSSLSAIERRCVVYFERDEPLIKPDWEEKALQSVEFGKQEWEMDKLELAKQEELLDAEDDPEAAVADIGEFEGERGIEAYQQSARLVQAQVDEEEDLLAELRDKYEDVRAAAVAGVSAGAAALGRGLAPPPQSAETLAHWAALREVQQRVLTIQKLGMLVKLPEELLKDPAEVAKEALAGSRQELERQRAEGTHRAMTHAAVKAATADLDSEMGHGSAAARGGVAAQAVQAASAAQADRMRATVAAAGKQMAGDTAGGAGGAPAPKRPKLKFRHKATVVTWKGSKSPKDLSPKAADGSALGTVAEQGLLAAPMASLSPATEELANTERKRKVGAIDDANAKRPKAEMTAGAAGMPMTAVAGFPLVPPTRKPQPMMGYSSTPTAPQLPAAVESPPGALSAAYLQAMQQAQSQQKQPQR